MEKLLARQAKLQDRIDACNAWELERQLEIAMDALRLPPGEAEVRTVLILQCRGRRYGQGRCHQIRPRQGLGRLQLLRVGPLK